MGGSNPVSGGYEIRIGDERRRKMRGYNMIFFDGRRQKGVKGFRGRKGEGRGAGSVKKIGIKMISKKYPNGTPRCFQQKVFYRNGGEMKKVRGDGKINQGRHPGSVPLRKVLQEGVIWSRKVGGFLKSRYTSKVRPGTRSGSYAQ